MGGVGGTITLSEASRFGHSTAFSLMLKPVGSRCNLRCSYCNYRSHGRRSGYVKGKNDRGDC